MREVVAVRPAVESDRDWLVYRLAKLNDLYGSAHSLLDAKDAAERLPWFMREHCLLVASVAGMRVGLVGGLFTPHILNREIRVLAETFWWSDRGPWRARVALALLDEFTTWGRRRGADWMTFSLLPQSPAGRSALQRRGFRVAETVYLLEE